MLAQKLQEDNERLRRALGNIADAVTLLMLSSVRGEYLDTGEALEVLQRIRTKARRAARAKRRIREED